MGIICNNCGWENLSNRSFCEKCQQPLNSDVPKSDKQDAPNRAEYFSANKYEGQSLNGVPHGKGTMYYGDGKRYTGDFVHGLRHGQGTLTMPNGESFIGRFQNDSITEDGVYYDENGRPRNVAKSGIKSLGSIIWDKSWRLLASGACFGMVALSVWAIKSFFTDGGHIRVGVFAAPIFFGWWGLIHLVKFFINLFNSKTN